MSWKKVFLYDSSNIHNCQNCWNHRFSHERKQQSWITPLWKILKKLCTCSSNGNIGNCSYISRYLFSQLTQWRMKLLACFSILLSIAEKLEDPFGPSTSLFSESFVEFRFSETIQEFQNAATAILKANCSSRESQRILRMF